MAFEVTATKKRPQNLEDLAGQEFVLHTLKNSISNDKIAHAYLFSGPRGVGKTSTARILARSLNCVQGPTIKPCGECAQCQEIVLGSSLDVIEIDGASNTGIDDIREIKDEVLYPPSSSNYKVFIIDEVHMLSNNAFNALLKTIEEPPPYIIFIFATTEAHKIPATVRSRCQQFNFKLIDQETIIRLLQEACLDINISAEAEALQWVARESTGSLRDAYTLFDQVVSFSEGQVINLDIIRTKLGLLGLDQISVIFNYLAAGDAHLAIEESHTVISSGIAIEQLCVDFADYLRSLLFIKSGIRREELIGYKKERYSEQALATWSLEQLQHALEQNLKLFRELRYSINPRFEWELFLAKLSVLSAYISPAQLVRRMEHLKDSLLADFELETTANDQLDMGSSKKKILIQEL